MHAALLRIRQAAPRGRDVQKTRAHGLDRCRQLTDLGDDPPGVIEGAAGDVALMEIESDERHERLPQRLR